MTKSIRRISILSVLAIFSMWSLASGLGCQKAEAPAPPPGIQYKIASEADISKVSLYKVKGDLPGSQYLTIDVTVKNISQSARGFLVGVKVDDLPTGYAGTDSSKAVEPGKEITAKVTAIVNSLPKQLWIGVETVAPPAK